MATAPLDRKAILRPIESWPQDEQLALARTIIERASRPAPDASGALARSTWDALYGIASRGALEDARGMLATSGQPAPTDEEIERWRMEKYGEA